MHIILLSIAYNKSCLWTKHTERHGEHSHKRKPTILLNFLPHRSWSIGICTVTFRFLPNTSCYNCWEKLLAPPPLGNRMVHGLCFQMCFQTFNSPSFSFLLLGFKDGLSILLVLPFCYHRWRSWRHWNWCWTERIKLVNVG